MSFKERFYSALNISGIESITKFCNQFNISKGNLSNILNNKANLPIGMAYKIHKAFAEMNVSCDIDYLLGNNENIPFIKSDEIVDIKILDNENIEKDISIFKKNINSVIYTAIDDCLEPFISVGDYVGGIKSYKDFDDYIKLPCIVNFNHKELGTNLTVTRILNTGLTSDTYTLYSNNIIPNSDTPNIYYAEINWLAMISFIRRDVI